MCGIGGVLIFPKQRNEVELTYIRALTSAIAVENQVRGKDSTGFATFDSKGGHILKSPIPAKELVTSVAFKNFARSKITRSTKNILIHTRMGTKGSEKNNDNNHPIETHRYIGVHNGMIWNDDELFKEHNLFRQAEVDSEVIFRLMDVQGKKLTTDKIRSVSETLEGNFTIAFCQKDKPNIMHIVRNDNPITLVYLPEFNIIAFASQRKFLEDAIIEANLAVAFELFADPEENTWLTPTYETIWKFDTDMNNVLEQLNQAPAHFKSIGYGYGGTSHSAWFNQEYYDDEIVFTPQSSVSATVKDYTTKHTFTSIMKRLTEEEAEVVSEFMESMESSAWSEGYSKGRESLANELEQVRTLSFEKGYEKGVDDGFDEGFEYRGRSNTEIAVRV